MERMQSDKFQKLLASIETGTDKASVLAELKKNKLQQDQLLAASCALQLSEEEQNELVLAMQELPPAETKEQPIFSNTYELVRHFFDDQNIMALNGVFELRNGIKLGAGDITSELYLWCQDNNVGSGLTKDRDIRAAFARIERETVVHRCLDIYNKLQYSTDIPERQYDLSKLESDDTEHNFDTGITPEESANEFDKFVQLVVEHDIMSMDSVDVLYSWMWNVKRTLLAKSINPMILKHNPELLQRAQVPMPVLYSPKGKTGKSTFNRKFLKPLEELAMVKKAADIGDDFSTLQWGKLVVADFDEMAGMHKADMNALKLWATNTVFTPRKMQSEVVHYVEKITHGIGSSNNSIEEIIWDTTGTRRFWQLEIHTTLWPVINEVDFVKLWQSVNEFSANPFDKIEDSITKTQYEEQRRKSPIEEFMDHFEKLKKPMQCQQFATAEIFDEYKVWWDAYGDGGKAKYAANTIGRDIKKFCSDKWVHVKGKQCNGFEYKG